MTPNQMSSLLLLGKVLETNRTTTKTKLETKLRRFLNPGAGFNLQKGAAI